jgi:ATP-dependent Clp protease ATP-binding subunit ClpC
MGARPLRRAIQRYIEDPLADEVLKATDMKPGATVEVDAHQEAPGEDGKEKEPEVKITIKAPSREREAVGVGAKGGSSEDAGEVPEGSGGSDLPDEPEVLPDVPDAPPAAEGETKPE